MLHRSRHALLTLLCVSLILTACAGIPAPVSQADMQQTIEAGVRATMAVQETIEASVRATLTAQPTQGAITHPAAIADRRAANRYYCTDQSAGRTDDRALYASHANSDRCGRNHRCA